VEDHTNPGGVPGDPKSELNRSGDARKAILQHILDLTVTQVVGSSEAIRAALASYAAGNSQNTYPATGVITDFDSLRLVVNANGGMLPLNTIFSVAHYDFNDSDGDSIADTYSMRLIVNGVSNTTVGAQLLLTPQGIFKCTASGNPC
jgi:hypothetical protein